MTFFPEGLSRDTFEALSRHVHESESSTLNQLLGEAMRHVERTRRAYTKNPLINLPLAEAIAGTIKSLVDDWDKVPQHACSWCKGMMRYFVSSDDEEPDFASPIGFDDDAEVLNACLRLAGREDLCVNPEDYDDA